MFACFSKSGKSTVKQSDFSGFVSYDDYFKQKVKGEYLPVVNRELFLSNLFYEDIRGGEQLTWFKITKNCGFVFMSSQIVRLYNDISLDRLSNKNRSFHKRVYKVFKKDLSVNFLDYIRIYPIGLMVTIIKICYYKINIVFSKI